MASLSARVLLALALVGAWLTNLKFAAEVWPAWLLAATSALFAAAVAAHAARRQPMAAGAVAMALLVWGAWIDPAGQAEHHARVLPAAALGAWLLARAARRNESEAAEAVVGVTAAVYVLAGASKLWHGGLGWLGSDNLALMLAERAVGGPAWLASLRMGIAERAWLCTGLAAATVLIECGAVVLLLPRPGLRRVWVAAALLMHAGIAVTMGYFYLPWMLVLGAIGVSSPSPKRSR